MADTIPIYPRPSDERVAQAIAVFFEIVEYIAPGAYVMDDALLRAGVVRGLSVAQAMWAVHELTKERGFAAFNFRETEGRSAGGVSYGQPPAGLEMAKGTIHMESRGYAWGELVFLPDHERLHELQVAKPRRDPEPDKSVRKTKRRTMNAAAANCARRFKKAKAVDPTTKMIHVVKEYVDQKNGSVDSIMRILNDNPDQWKT